MPNEPLLQNPCRKETQMKTTENQASYILLLMELLVLTLIRLLSYPSVSLHWSSKGTASLRKVRCVMLEQQQPYNYFCLTTPSCADWTNLSKL